MPKGGLHTRRTEHQSMGPRFTRISDSVHQTLFNTLVNQSRTVVDTLHSIPTSFATLNSSEFPSITDALNVTDAQFIRIQTEAVALASPTALPGLLMLCAFTCRFSHVLLVWLLAKRMLRRRPKVD